MDEVNNSFDTGTEYLVVIVCSPCIHTALVSANVPTNRSQAPSYASEAYLCKWIPEIISMLLIKLCTSRYPPA